MRRPMPAVCSTWVLVLTALMLAAFALSGCTVAYDDESYYEEPYEEEAEWSPSDEFDDLGFWGQWVELAPYGEVWRPSVVMGWRPYAHGQWLWTDMGWTWLSYEPFGWATYHYGFWAHDFVWGWFWVPGYDWHPALVEWVVYDDFIAWAPLPPPGFAIHDPWAELEIEVWHVVPAERFAEQDVDRYHVAYKDRVETRERSVVKYKGPDARMVERAVPRAPRAVKVELVRSARDARVERMKLPENENKVVARYREETEKKIRPPEPPPAERPREVRVRDERERPEPPDTSKSERARKPAVKRSEKKDKPTVRKPVKKKATERDAENKDGSKKDPEKKEPEKKEPEKKAPTKKPVKEKPTQKPRKG